MLQLTIRLRHGEAGSCFTNTDVREGAKVWRCLSLHRIKTASLCSPTSGVHSESFSYKGVLWGVLFLSRGSVSKPGWPVCCEPLLACRKGASAWQGTCGGH